MNFFRRPALTQLLGQSSHRKGVRRHASGDLDPTLRSSIDNVLDQYDAQVAETEDIVTEALKASMNLRKQLEGTLTFLSKMSDSCSLATANASKEFAAVLARFSDRSGNLMNSACLAGSTGNGKPATADANTDLMASQAEHQKGTMLMAATHQLAKFYMLMAAVNQDLANALDKEFEAPTAERQARYFEKLDIWYEEYEETVRPVMEQIHRHKLEVSKADGDKQIEIYDEISNCIRQLAIIKRSKLRAGLKLERHHYVHITHRIQNAFRRQLPLFKTIYMQEIECVPDLLETAPFAAIVARHPKPSQLYLRLKKPQELDASPETKKLDVITEEEMNEEAGHSLPAEQNQWLVKSPEEKSSLPGVLSAPEIMRELEETEKLISIPLTPVLNHTKLPVEEDSGEGEPQALDDIDLANVVGESATILYDYTGSGDNDLSVKRNEPVKIVQVEGEWAYVLKSSDDEAEPEMGWVPLSFTSLGAAQMMK